MENTIEAFCTVCGKITYFCFDGEYWECQECEGLNTQAKNSDSKTITNEYVD